MMHGRRGSAIPAHQARVRGDDGNDSGRRGAGSQSAPLPEQAHADAWRSRNRWPAAQKHVVATPRSEEHTSELQSLMRISYAVFCLKKKKTNNTHTVMTQN